MKSAAFVLSKIGAALFILTMSFSYADGLNPPIDYPRLLISDTQEFQPDGTTRAYIFSDQEIISMTRIVGNVYQSTMQYDPPITVQVPPYPVSYVRIAAYLLNSLAANTARLTGILQILDVKLDMKSATKARFKIRRKRGRTLTTTPALS